VLKIDDWGNRKLAYTIKKKSNAFYTFLLYTGTARRRRGGAQHQDLRGDSPPLTTLHTAELKPKVEAAAPPAGDAPADAGTPAPETPQAPRPPRKPDRQGG